MLKWINNYFNTLMNLQLDTQISDLQNNTLALQEGFQRYINYAKGTRPNHKKIIFIGNGGSAGIASHLAIDHSKNGHLPAIAFSDPAALTCLSNDYGFEFVFSKQIQLHAHQNDLLVAISSSGKSANILNAVAAARDKGCQIVTFSGFDPNNPLRKLGDVNFYVDAKEYGFVEVAHLSLVHAMLDYIIEEQHQAHAAKHPDLTTA